MKPVANKYFHVRTLSVVPSIASYAKPEAQRGAVLVLALVLLMVLTLIGVQSMSSSSLELKLAANAEQHSVAFQAAQSRIAFASSADPVNPINFLIAIPDFTNPPVQFCDPPVCPNGGAGKYAWVATGQVDYLDCSKGYGSSLEAGKGFSFRIFEITATGETATLSSRSTQVGAVRYPVKSCGDEI